MEIESSLVENNDSWCWASSLCHHFELFYEFDFDVISKKLYLHHDHKDFLLYFLFKFLCFMFHIKLILKNGMRYRRYGQFFLCMYVCMGSQLFHYSLLKNLLLFTQLPLHFCRKSIVHIYVCVCLFLVPPISV